MHETSKKRAARCLPLLLAAAMLITTPALAAGGVGERMLVPVGHTVGIKLFSRGVVVVKLSEGGTPAKECGLQTGDIITQYNNTAVLSTEHFKSLLQEDGGGTGDLEVCRSGNTLTLQVEPETNDAGVYCIGAWIRDSMAGIGTMTYYDPKTGEFGALGHGITDVDTAQLMPFANGSILPSAVKAVKKGEAGSAGELKGDFTLDRHLGDLSANTDCGIFGTLSVSDYAPAMGKAVPVGTAQPGQAEIWSNVEGDSVERYAIEIQQVSETAVNGRNLTIRVTDPNLLAATGGIVQGMSGSPIIQDGKLVGAVTHVLVNDPTRGYGIFIENMLDAAG